MNRKNKDKNPEKIQMNNKNKKYHINHQNTNNKELAVTITQTLSKILDKSISEIDLNNYFNIEALNQIYKEYNPNSSITSKITFHIENHKIEIYNNKDIIITQKNQNPNFQNINY